MLKPKVKPQVLARRKAKQALSQRKNSLAHLKGNQNSSMVSLKTGEERTSSNMLETPLDTVDRIQELFEKLQKIERR